LTGLPNLIKHPKIQIGCELGPWEYAVKRFNHTSAARCGVRVKIQKPSPPDRQKLTVEEFIARKHVTHPTVAVFRQVLELYGGASAAHANMIQQCQNTVRTPSAYRGIERGVDSVF
jgi:hypothetical protein